VAPGVFPGVSPGLPDFFTLEFPIHRCPRNGNCKQLRKALYSLEFGLDSWVLNDLARSSCGNCDAGDTINYHQHFHLH
jgi:hypothetical protein